LQKGINIDTSTFQERTLSTPIVVDGANKTTVEDALSSINTLAKSNKTALASKVSTSLTNGLLKNDGTVDTNTYLTEHQDISGKQNKVLDTPIMVEDVEQTTVEGALSAINNKTYNSFPQGGATGQVLAKKSNDDYDVEWVNQSGGGGGGGTGDFDELTNRPTESEVINISDLDLTLPAKPTDYPILFDDGEGTERQVGYYRRSTDGKVKPIYEKYIKSESFEATLPLGNDKVRVLYSYTNSSLTDASIVFTNLIGYTTTGSNDGFLDYYINDEYLQSSNRFIPNADTKIDDFTVSLNPGDTLYVKTNWVNSHSNNSWKLSGDYVVTGIDWQILSAESYKNIESDIYNKILYTKTTDEWKEV
jgi:hypothetical protein